MEIKERTCEFIKAKGLSKSEFERRCGLSNGYINSMRSGYGLAKLERVLREFPDLSKDWLIYGEGPMLRPVVDSSVIVNGNGNFGNGNGNTIQQVGTATSSAEAVLAERVKSLEALVNEKERLIKVLMERK